MWLVNIATDNSDSCSFSYSAPSAGGLPSMVRAAGTCVSQPTARLRLSTGYGERWDRLLTI